MYGLSTLYDVKSNPIDTVCKWQFSSRSHVVGAVLNDDLYIIGGYKGHGLGPSNSVWYRRIYYYHYYILLLLFLLLLLLLFIIYYLLEHKPPKGQFTKTPRNKHADHIFKFKCDEDACLYEYRMWKMKNGKFDKYIRQWTVTVYIYYNYYYYIYI